jgi:hypothetical protein
MSDIEVDGKWKGHVELKGMVSDGSLEIYDFTCYGGFKRAWCPAPIIEIYTKIPRIWLGYCIIDALVYSKNRDLVEKY